MNEPRTKAGKRLLTEVWTFEDEYQFEASLEAILAIEAEAAQAGVKAAYLIGLEEGRESATKILRKIVRLAEEAEERHFPKANNPRLEPALHYILRIAGTARSALGLVATPAEGPEEER